jgi:hypothetical protein
LKNRLNQAIIEPVAARTARASSVKNIRTVENFSQGSF